ARREPAREIDTGAPAERAGEGVDVVPYGLRGPGEAIGERTSRAPALDSRDPPQQARSAHVERHDRLVARCISPAEILRLRPDVGSHQVERLRGAARSGR